MRKGVLLAVILLFLLAAGVLIGVAVSSRRGGELPAPAQARLEQYLAYAFDDRPMVVAAIDRSGHPSRLTAGIAGAAFGNSVHFQTDLGAPDVGAGDRSPLPFPPSDVWCVLLKGEGPPAGQVVLLALHMDLHTADWVVYQGPDDASSVEAQHLLSTLGCTLSPEPGDFNALDRAKQNGNRGYGSEDPGIFD